MKNVSAFIRKEIGSLKVDDVTILQVPVRPGPVVSLYQGASGKKFSVRETVNGYHIKRIK